MTPQAASQFLWTSWQTSHRIWHLVYFSLDTKVSFRVAKRSFWRCFRLGNIDRISLRLKLVSHRYLNQLHMRPKRDRSSSWRLGLVRDIRTRSTLWCSHREEDPARWIKWAACSSFIAIAIPVRASSQSIAIDSTAGILSYFLTALSLWPILVLVIRVAFHPVYFIL